MSTSYFLSPPAAAVPARLPNAVPNAALPAGPPRTNPSVPPISLPKPALLLLLFGRNPSSC